MFVYHHSWAMMLGMFAFWLLVLALGIWLLAKLFPAAVSYREAEAEPAAKTSDPAVEIVRHRFARGEITEAEYDELLRTLG